VFSTSAEKWSNIRRRTRLEKLSPNIFFSAVFEALPKTIHSNFGSGGQLVEEKSPRDIVAELETPTGSKSDLNHEDSPFLAATALTTSEWLFATVIIILPAPKSLLRVVCGRAAKELTSL
jgi:hypothetical protein